MYCRVGRIVSSLYTMDKGVFDDDKTRRGSNGSSSRRAPGQGLTMELPRTPPWTFRRGGSQRGPRQTPRHSATCTCRCLGRKVSQAPPPPPLAPSPRGIGEHHPKASMLRAGMSCHDSWGEARTQSTCKREWWNGDRNVWGSMLPQVS